MLGLMFMLRSDDLMSQWKDGSIVLHCIFQHLGKYLYGTSIILMCRPFSVVDRGSLANRACILTSSVDQNLLC